MNTSLRLPEETTQGGFIVKKTGPPRSSSSENADRSGSPYPESPSCSEGILSEGEEAEDDIEEMRRDKDAFLSSLHSNLAELYQGKLSVLTYLLFVLFC